MYIRSDNWFGKDTNHTLRVTMEDFDSGVAKWTRTVSALPVQGVGNRYYDGKREQPVDVKDLPPGQYKCVVTLVDGRGKDVASDYAFFAKPDGKAPENDRANRHATAYFKIHDLGVAGDIGSQWTKPDAALRPFGASRRHSAYYTGDCPVTVSNPSERFLYALYEGDGERKMLILLNDTDDEVSQTVSVAGLKAKGEDIFSKEQFDFTTGKCTFTLPPRESRFVLFQGTAGTSAGTTSRTRNRMNTSRASKRWALSDKNGRPYQSFNVSMTGPRRPDG